MAQVARFGSSEKAVKESAKLNVKFYFQEDLTIKLWLTCAASLSGLSVHVDSPIGYGYLHCSISYQYICVCMCNYSEWMCDMTVMLSVMSLAFGECPAMYFVFKYSSPSFCLLWAILCSVRLLYDICDSNIHCTMQSVCPFTVVFKVWKTCLFKFGVDGRFNLQY